MRNTVFLVLACGVALGALGCGDSDAADGSGGDGGTGKADSGTGQADSGIDNSDSGAMSVDVPMRTGIAATGQRPSRAPDSEDGKEAGKGNTATETEQEGDEGDPVWMVEDDVNGDGIAETVTTLFDDETGTLYVWYTQREATCTTEVLVIFDGDGEGNPGDGSGRYLIDTTCDETDDFLGCEFDADGEDTTCGVCMRNSVQQLWQCLADGSNPDECACDVDLECTSGCLCDVECLEMCECDVDLTCSDNCECDYECVFGECACDVDFECTEGCECDFECSEDFCECDVDFTCSDNCECDVEC